MIIDNSKLSFHDVLATASIQQAPGGIEPGKVKTMHLIIGGVVAVAIFGIGYYIGKQQTIKFSVRKYDPIYSEEVDKE